MEGFQTTTKEGMELQKKGESNQDAMLRLAQQQAKEREVDTAEEHEDRDHDMEVGPVAGEAGILGRKPAGGHRAKGVADGIEGRHDTQPQ